MISRACGNSEISTDKGGDISFRLENKFIFKINFVISPLKHMFWVLSETVEHHCIGLSCWI